MHPAPEAKDNPRKTFICIGVARGGTSAVAGTMQRLGIHMGDDLPPNYEDPEFNAANLPAMKDVIVRRNAEHKVWGWKNPHAANHLEHLLPGIENPHLVVVCRDLAATLKAHVRWHNRTTQFAVHEILLQQQRNWFLTERWQVPTALVSYEKLVLDPELFVQDMADFLSVPQPKTRQRRAIAAFLTPGSYK